MPFCQGTKTSRDGRRLGNGEKLGTWRQSVFEITFNHGYLGSDISESFIQVPGSRLTQFPLRRFYTQLILICESWFSFVSLPSRALAFLTGSRPKSKIDIKSRRPRSSNILKNGSVSLVSWITGWKFDRGRDIGNRIFSCRRTEHSYLKQR